MTNAYVANRSVTAKDGDTLMVKYKDGEKKVIVTPTTVIAASAPGSKDELKVGCADHYLAARKSSRMARCWPRSCMSAVAVTPAM